MTFVEMATILFQYWSTCILWGKLLILDQVTIQQAEVIEDHTLLLGTHGNESDSTQV